MGKAIVVARESFIFPGRKMVVYLAARLEVKDGRSTYASLATFPVDGVEEPVEYPTFESAARVAKRYNEGPSRGMRRPAWDKIGANWVEQE